MRLTDELLTGRDDRQIDRDTLGLPVHRALVPAWLELAAQARRAGFDLAIASGYRDYERQLSIWNRKASGQRPLLDSEGRPLDAARLDGWPLAEAILRWSALPGASRHHWGSDIDVYDRAALPEGYQLRLTPDEVADDGLFGPLHRWLDERLATGAGCGFFRPYGQDRGGVAPERWHLSYAPVAAAYQRELNPARLLRAIDQPELQLRDVVRLRWAEVFRRYIWVSPALYPQQARP
jgi:LAS superfamily LD-carboxypeptidase LdcB